MGTHQPTDLLLGQSMALGGDLRPWGHVTHWDTSPMGTHQLMDLLPGQSMALGGDLRPWGHVIHGDPSAYRSHPKANLGHEDHQDTGDMPPMVDRTVHRSPPHSQLGYREDIRPWGPISHGDVSPMGSH